VRLCPKRSPLSEKKNKEKKGFSVPRSLTSQLEQQPTMITVAAQEPALQSPPPPSSPPPNTFPHFPSASPSAKRQAPSEPEGQAELKRAAVYASVEEVSMEDEEEVRYRQLVKRLGKTSWRGSGDEQLSCISLHAVCICFHCCVSACVVGGVSCGDNTTVRVRVVQHLGEA
jgi:hypothetical protein